MPRMEKLAHAESQLLMGGGHVAKKRRWRIEKSQHCVGHPCGQVFATGWGGKECEKRGKSVFTDVPI